MTCTKCKESTAAHRDRSNGFAERALRLALSLPDDVTCRKNFKPAQAEFLSSLRDLAAGYSSAGTWSQAETAVRLEALRFGTAVAACVAAEISVDLRNNGGGGSGLSCTASCDSDLSNCTGNCDNDEDAGYFCYFDCRLSYMACLARCITHGVIWGGGGVIAA